MADNQVFQQFLDAQAAVYEQVLVMLREGQMCSPYMDFIFPSPGPAGNRFALRSPAEARAYIASPILGSRYLECVAALSWLWRGAARDVFGDTDANKLEASLALFDEVTGDPLIGAMLALWFDRPGQDLVAGLAIPS